MTTTFDQLPSHDFQQHVLSRMPRVAAFDCDGTLWAPDSGFGFMKWEIDNGFLPKQSGEALLKRYELYKAGEVSEYDMCGEMVAIHAGIKVEDIIAASRRFAETEVKPYIFPAMEELVHRLQDTGCEIWAVTSTASWVVREGLVPFGIAANRVLGVELACANGVATAEILAVPTDEHKAAALKRASVLPDAVFGNSMHDLQMLEMARDAYAVNPNTDLRRTAEGRGWVVFDPQTTM